MTALVRPSRQGPRHGCECLAIVVLALATLAFGFYVANSSNYDCT